MALYISNDMKAAAAQSRLTTMQARSAPLTIKLYDGTQPSAGGAVTNQTMLLSAALASTPATVNGSTLTFVLANALNQITATGTPTWGRIADSTGAWLVDANAGVAGGGAVFTVDQVPIYQGGYIAALTLSLTEQ